MAGGLPSTSSLDATDTLRRYPLLFSVVLEHAVSKWITARIYFYGSKTSPVSRVQE